MQGVLLRDGLPLYDLPETSRRLLQGPGWLRRRARAQALPHVWIGGALAFPRAWVDAASGERPADPASVAGYWRKRLAPPPPDAHRAVRDLSDLPLGPEDLIDEAHAGQALCASPAALARLEADGTLPVFQVDGQRRLDRTLVDLLAEAAAGPSLTPGDLEGRIARRREEVAAHARFAFRTSRPAPAARGEADRAADAAAYALPADLDLGAIEPLPPVVPRIVEADGYEVIEDD